MIVSYSTAAYKHEQTGVQRQIDKGTGRSTSTTNCCPGERVVPGGGAEMTTLCAAATAAQRTAMKKDFIEVELGATVCCLLSVRCTTSANFYRQWLAPAPRLYVESVVPPWSRPKVQINIETCNIKFLHKLYHLDFGVAAEG